MKTIPFFCLALVGWLAFALVAHAEVTWRVSVKIFVDDNGNRPGSPITDADIQAQFDFANTNPYFIGRGLKLEKSEVLDIAVPANAPKDWFSVDLMAANNMTVLEREAKGDPAYRWRDDKINLYINQGTASGAALRPGDGDIIVFRATKVENTPWVFIHEIGHHMSLKHTFFGEQFQNRDGSNCTNGCSCAVLVPGDDDIADTLLDTDCWNTKDQIAQGNFKKDWSELSSRDQARVDNTFVNIMCYRNNRSIFTTLQLDAMCDTSNVERDAVSHNNLVFVDVLSPGIQANGLSKIQPFGGPYHTLKEGIDASFGGDVLLLRPGSYAENREIRGAITLRAVRRDVLTPGNAIIRAQ
jgi:hypothetical protein